jgi:ribonuclease P protein component
MKACDRVKRHEEFQDIIRANHCERTPAFACYYQSNGLNRARVGISVSKKMGNAVVRNRIKRQIRAMVDELMDFRLPLDLIIVARVAYDRDNFDKGKAQMAVLLDNMRRKADDKKDKGNT